MLNLHQKITARREDAERRLREGEADLAAAQCRVEKCRLEIDIIDGLLDDSPGSSANIVPSRLSAGSNGNEVPVVGATAQAMAKVLERNGGKLTIQELVEGLIADGFGPESDRARISNNASSVFYRAIKDPHHPLFRKAGRGEIVLASHAKH